MVASLFKQAVKLDKDHTKSIAKEKKLRTPQLSSEGDHWQSEQVDSTMGVCWEES
jgi:hypothetical protein